MSFSSQNRHFQKASENVISVRDISPGLNSTSPVSRTNSPKLCTSLRSSLSSLSSPSSSSTLPTSLSSGAQPLMTNASAPVGQIRVSPPTSSDSPGLGPVVGGLPSATTALPGNEPKKPPQPIPPSGQPCCESGRPVLTDPISGQTVCSCQYDSHLLNYQRLAASTAIPLGMYNPAAAAAVYGAAAAAGDQPFLPTLTPEQLQSAFYSPTGNGFDLKENLEAWRNLPYAAAASMYYPYDGGALSGYPFGNGYGMDLNGARRKNATRETTSTLKAWLNEHRKNPYPTKGEKIMLAIITKMTLTQVSTWFANARRRLKKENKMTWSPRNRCDDDDPADEEGKDGNESSSGGVDDYVDVDDDGKDERSLNESDTRDEVIEENSSKRGEGDSGPSGSQSNFIHSHKPRIWSIVDIATSSNTLSSSSSAPPATSTPMAANRTPTINYVSFPYSKPSGSTLFSVRRM